MALGVDLPLSGGATARVRVSGVDDGDMRVDGDPLLVDARRASLVDLPWVWVRQVHGAAVVVVDDPEAAASVLGTEADAVVSAVPQVVAAVHTADCAPVALVGDRGVVAAVHAGWRGVEAGVLQGAVRSMRSAGSGPVRAWLGPCIHPECYEFGEEDLERLAVRFGPGVRSRTALGAPALDLPAAVARVLGEVGVEVTGADLCTSCAPGWFSHRARRDSGRQALAVWVERRS